ncbi:MAG: hypothetical protein A3C36_00790 [Omnitrophica WOR_2 bacterium RIFCSPHIGHO2_02_FULL_52_10]|nr:MAG: hypothetical protein A3C36_00790 [Omnitrophica WOR_2 bacterium RIFCSPHIGHO2_02_FULL_52_10]
MPHTDTRDWKEFKGLGGALVALAVDSLTEEDEDISGLYTFGQPRVGDKEFTENFDWKIKSRSFRFVNDEDIVTRVPPRLFGHEETGTARSLGRFGELRSRYPNGIDDHSLNRYLANIRKNYVKEKGIKTYKDYLDGM